MQNILKFIVFFNKIYLIPSYQNNFRLAFIKKKFYFFKAYYVS